jgi:hypothetical protein
MHAESGALEWDIMHYRRAIKLSSVGLSLTAETTTLPPPLRGAPWLAVLRLEWSDFHCRLARFERFPRENGGVETAFESPKAGDPTKGLRR